MKERVYQFVDDVITLGERRLLESVAELDPKLARELMTEIAHELCFKWAKTELYIPAMLELTLGPRNQQMWEKYGQTGPNGVRPYTAHRVDQLAAEYGVTPRHMQRILARMRVQDAAARQAELPGLDPES